MKYIQDKMTINVEELGADCLTNVAKTAMASKVIGMYVVFAFGPPSVHWLNF